MKIMIAVLFSFSIIINLATSVHAGHEISHVSVKHAQERSEQEIDAALNAEIEEEEAHSHHRHGHYGHGYRSYGHYGSGAGDGDGDENELAMESDSDSANQNGGYWDYGNPNRGVMYYKN